MSGAAGVHRREVEFSWGASYLTIAMAISVAVSISVAIAMSQWQLVAFAAPMLGALCSLAWQPRLPLGELCVLTESLGFFEGENVQVTVWLESGSADSRLALDVSSVIGLAMEVVQSKPDRLTVSCTAQRWGRYPLQVQVTVSGCGGMLFGVASVEAVTLHVFPLAPARSTAIPRTDLPDRIGAHVGRRAGAGVEYADIRPYAPGDPLRAVNWPVSARRRSLHVTERLSEQAADVVVLIDTYPQPLGPATAATERTVRGAMQVIQTALRRGDRAGIVALGGRQPRWLAPDIGQRQFYRVLDATLGAGSGFTQSNGSLVPRLAVPPGAVVIGFSTLLNTNFGFALLDLRRRGHAVVAVDVLRGVPAATDGDPSLAEAVRDPLISRIWSLERSFLYRASRSVGIDVVPWREGNTLDEAMQLIPDRRAGGRPPA